MNLKVFILLTIFTSVMFAFVYGSKHKVVNLKEFHEHMTAYYKSTGYYPDSLDAIKEAKLQPWQRKKEGASLTGMMKVFRENQYQLEYTTDEKLQSYQLQISKGDFCKRLLSTARDIQSCH